MTDEEPDYFIEYPVRYFMSDKDMEMFECDSRYCIKYGIPNSDHMRAVIWDGIAPISVMAPSIEVACLFVKGQGWNAYPFKFEDGSFQVWAWPDGLLIRITWEMPPKNEDDPPTYDITMVEFSPLNYKKEYKSGDFSMMMTGRSRKDGLIYMPICRKVELVNRSSPTQLQE